MPTKRKPRNPFREAKKYLWDGKRDMTKTPYICYALKRLARAHPLMEPAVVTARRMVEQRLGRCLSVSEWVYSNWTIQQRYKTSRNIQFFRHRWLDYLADEWDKGVRV